LQKRRVAVADVEVREVPKLVLGRAVLTLASPMRATCVALAVAVIASADRTIENRRVTTR
jgi:ABC-type thiamine transport system ATPase subunit